MSLKPIWKDRALARAKEVQFVNITLNVVPSGFAVKSFTEIRDSMIAEMKKRMPEFGQALDDPTSVIRGIIESVAAVDADQFKQIEAIATFIEDKGVKIT